MMKMITLIDWKPTRAIYAKVKGCDKVTASDWTWLTWGISVVKRTYIKSDMTHLGHFSSQKTSILKLLQIKDSKQWNSKLSGRIAVIVFNVPFPYDYHFPNFLKIRGATPLAGHHSFKLIWACALYFKSSFISTCIISSIFDVNT